MTTVVQYLAKSVLNYGGFCFLAHQGSLVKNYRLDQKIDRHFIHTVHESSANRFGIRSEDDTTRMIGDANRSLLLKNIFYAIYPEWNDYSFYISINGYLADLAPPEDGECLVGAPVLRKDNGAQVIYKTFSSEFDGSFNSAAANVFWFAKCKKGYSVMAAFLLPFSDARNLLKLFIEKTNDFHSLVATIFPAYNQIYPNLSLGRARLLNAVPMREFKLVFEHKGEVQYKPQGIVTNFRLEA